MTRMRIAALFGLLSLPLQAQWINQKTPGIPRTPNGKADLTSPAPRTPEGKPDFSGVWTLSGTGGGLSQLKASEIKPWAEALHQQREENLARDSPGVLCLPEGFHENGFVKIVQTPALVIMLFEGLEYRQIFLDGRSLPSDPNPAWEGYSVGHWDGETLVVESTGYNDRSWLEGSRGYPHTENLRLTERWRRADFGHLEMELTHSDPAIYSKPWTSKVAGSYTPDTDLIEFVCAENEKDQSHLVGTRSDDLKKAVKLPPEVLARYVGTYELPEGVERAEIKIAFEDGELKFSRGGGSKRPALSETKFAQLGGYVDFGKNENGDVTYLVLQIPEGTFERIERRIDSRPFLLPTPMGG